MPKFVEYRQGDVFLVKIPSSYQVETTARIPAEGSRIILAYGEATGHAHAISSSSAELYSVDPHIFGKTFHKDFEMARAANTRFLRVLQPTPLLHEEHDPLDLQPGNYLVSIQISLDEDGEWSRVED